MYDRTATHPHRIAAKEGMIAEMSRDRRQPSTRPPREASHPCPWRFGSTKDGEHSGGRCRSFAVAVAAPVPSATPKRPTGVVYERLVRAPECVRRERSIQGRSRLGPRRRRHGGRRCRRGRRSPRNRRGARASSRSPADPRQRKPSRAGSSAMARPTDAASAACHQNVLRHRLQVQVGPPCREAGGLSLSEMVVTYSPALCYG